MKILFLTHYFLPEGNAPASRTYEHTKRWVKAGHKVTVITSHPNVPHGRIYPGYRNSPWFREYLDGIEVIRVWTFLAANAGTLRRTLNYLSYMVSATLAGLFRERPDVIVATSPQFFCGWAGVLLSRLTGVKLALEIRDIWPDSIAAVGAIKGTPILRFLSLLEAQMYQAAHRIVTVGPGYRAELCHRNVPQEIITVIPNGADLTRFKTTGLRHQLRKQWETGTRFVCAYIGTIGMASGLDIVLAVAEQLRTEGREEFEFWLVGDGSDRQRLQEAANKRGLDRVRFVGLAPKSAIPAYLETADVCLVHLRDEPLFTTVLPSKMFEAMAMERPIILGVRGSAAEVLEAAKAGIAIEPENHRDLYDALTTLQEAPERRQTMGRAGREFVRQEYNRDRSAEAYLTLLTEEF